MNRANVRTQIRVSPSYGGAAFPTGSSDSGDVKLQFRIAPQRFGDEPVDSRVRCAVAERSHYHYKSNLNDCFQMGMNRSKREFLRTPDGTRPLGRTPLFSGSAE